MDSDHDADGILPAEIDKIMSHEVIPHVCDVALQKLDAGRSVQEVIGDIRGWLRDFR